MFNGDLPLAPGLGTAFTQLSLRGSKEAIVVVTCLGITAATSRPVIIVSLTRSPEGDALTNPGRVRHNLGFDFGSVFTEPDGTVEYVKGLSTIFKMRVQDVTGFTVGKGTRWYDRNLQILGHGTTLATVTDLGVTHVEEIQEIFRSHPMFGNGPGGDVSGGATVSLADEIKKLADLRATGALSEDEFQELKSRLISGD